MKIKRYMRAFLMLTSTIAAFALCGQVQASADTVTMTVERSSIGGDLIMSPREVSFTPGETYADLVQRVLDTLKTEGRIAGYSHTMGTHGFYLSGIDGVDCGIGNMPACVRRIFDDRNAMITENPNPGGLYEFSYAGGAGWMYYVNNNYMNGMSLEHPQDGDVVRLMFTVFMGADLTGTFRDSTTGAVVKTYYTPGDKSGLIRLLCEADQKGRWSAVDGSGAAYAQARAVLLQMDATAADIAGAVDRLQDIKRKAVPTSLAFTTSEPLMLKVGGRAGSLAGRLQMQPSYDPGNLSWSSSDSWVARVDAGGDVTPVGEGTCTVTVRTYNGLSASCTVNVTKDQIPVRGVALSKKDLELFIGGEPETLSYTTDPVDADESGHRWESLDPAIAAVDGSGRVTPVSKGETDIRITVEGAGGTSASALCHVTVGDPVQSLQMAQESVALHIDETPQPLAYTRVPADSLDLVRWESSDPQTVDVDSAGRLTLRRVGEAQISVISVHDQDVRAVCRLTVLPSRKDDFHAGKPVVQAALAGDGSVRIAWEAYEGADSYRILRREERKLFTLLDTVPAGETCAYTDTTAEPGKGYYYTVQAVSTALDCWSDYDRDPFVRIPETPSPQPADPSPQPEKTAGKTAIQKIARVSYDKLKLTWTRAANATGYRIYRSTSARGAYKRVKELQGQGTLSYTDTGLATGTTYYYKICAVRKASGRVTEGPRTAAKSGQPTLGRVTARAAAGKKRAQISWSRVDGATGYVLYRATREKGAYKAIKTVKRPAAGRYTDKKLKAGKTYYYRVRTYRNVGKKRVWGDHSAIRRVRIRS